MRHLGWRHGKKRAGGKETEQPFQEGQYCQAPFWKEGACCVGSIVGFLVVVCFFVVTTKCFVSSTKYMCCPNLFWLLPGDVDVCCLPLFYICRAIRHLGLPTIYLIISPNQKLVGTKLLNILCCWFKPSVFALLQKWDASVTRGLSDTEITFVDYVIQIFCIKFLSWVCYSLFFFLVSYLSDYLMVATMNYLQVAPSLVGVFYPFDQTYNIAVIVTEN